MQSKDLPAKLWEERISILLQFQKVAAPSKKISRKNRKIFFKT
jgi:hypothetical protein